MSEPADQRPRVFTVEEANALVDELEEVVERIVATRAAAQEDQRKLQVLDALWEEKVREEENPDHEEYVRRTERLQRAEKSLRSVVKEQIVDRGIRFPPGGLEHGLLDFPTTLDGRWVFLCWQLGEPEVAYWHELDGGYRGRQPITPEEATRMGRSDAPGGGS